MMRRPPPDDDEPAAKQRGKNNRESATPREPCACDSVGREGRLQGNVWYYLER
jgi:hypothetical protein